VERIAGEVRDIGDQNLQAALNDSEATLAALIKLAQDAGLLEAVPGSRRLSRNAAGRLVTPTAHELRLQLQRYAMPPPLPSS
jgi:hypothetical protein